MTRTHWFLAATAFLALAGAETAAADVPAGIAAWQAGDYARAVAEWRPLAEAGDADAQFNLGQAYRLGRGVPQDLRLAEQWFERAARQRHEQAGANLGLLLFQNGRAREAMPWIQAAAMRGDPRAQYVFGTALFNGDVVRRDLPRAYALMSRAAAQGFPQAAEQLRQMEPFLSDADRRAGTALAAQMAGPQPPRQMAEAEPRPVPVPAVTGRPGTGAGVSYAAPGTASPPRGRPEEHT
ncbi:tetratricopeptide repeat protein, partial [Sphingosinicella sp. YJ22]|uniref:tetratricopeptide repeat protein n=1 Tax=Sphingosinicella sp. YJ22 TaxID=1104780 RepID=UPI00140B48D0